MPVRWDVPVAKDDNMSVGRWTVQKRDHKWAIIDRKGYWHDSEETLPEAMDWAWRFATVDQLFANDGVVRCKELIDKAAWWDAYMRACEEHIFRADNRAKAVIT